MTNTYFKSKEQYFQFRTNFAAAANNVKSKSTCEACDEYHRHEEELTYDTGMSRIQGWLHAERDKRKECDYTKNKIVVTLDETFIDRGYPKKGVDND